MVKLLKAEVRLALQKNTREGQQGGLQRHNERRPVNDIQTKKYQA